MVQKVACEGRRYKKDTVEDEGCRRWHVNEGRRYKIGTVEDEGCRRWHVKGEGKN